MASFSVTRGFPAPSIVRNAFLMGSREHKAAQKVMDAQTDSLSRYGGQNSQFRELSRYYLSLSPPLLGRENDRPLNPNDQESPDLFVARSFTAVEAATPPWIFAVLGQTPRVYARKAEREDNAGAVQAMLKYDWERSEVLYRSIHVAKQMFKYGTGIAKVGYKYDKYDIERSVERTIPLTLNDDFTVRTTRTDRLKKKESVIRFDGPWLEPWSVYHFHPDPFYPRIPDMRWVNAGRWTDRETLRLENENHKKHTGKDLYKHLDKIPAVRRGYAEEMYQQDTYGDDIAEAMGWSRTGGITRNRYAGSGSRNINDDLVYIIEHWARDDEVIYLANGEVPILDGTNPYDDKEIPFVATRCHVIDGQFWGYGILHPMKRSQEELNSHRNLIMRQAQLNIMNVWAYDEATGVHDDLEDMRPGGLYGIPFHANGNPGVVPLVNGPNLPPEAYAIEDRIDSDIQTAIGMPGYRQQITAKTATEATLESSMIESRARMQALGGELTYANEIARLFHSRRQQFLKSEGETFRILGPKGAEYKRMTPEDIAGEYDFLMAGQHIHASRDVMRQQLLQGIALIKGDPNLMQITDVPEVWQEFWKMMDFPYPERFYSPPPQRVLEPRHENIILLQGEWIEVETNDDHEAHVAEHTKALPETAGNEEAFEQMQAHIAEHNRYIKELQAQAPPQEQPGLRGYAGNQPNLENATESQAGLQARVGGAGNSQ
jgi:hypothetical protein